MANQGDLRTVAGKAVADPDFRQKLIEDPEAAVKEAGIDMTDESPQRYGQRAVRTRHG